MNLEEELPPFAGATRFETQDAQGWTGAVGYEFDENVRMAAGYQHYDFDGPAGAGVTGLVPVCDTLDADLVYLETSIAFEQ